MAGEDDGEELDGEELDGEELDGDELDVESVPPGVVPVPPAAGASIRSATMTPSHAPARATTRCEPVTLEFRGG